jgi:hypothetical protein
VIGSSSTSGIIDSSGSTGTIGSSTIGSTIIGTSVTHGTTPLFVAGHPDGKERHTPLSPQDRHNQSQAAQSVQPDRIRQDRHFRYDTRHRNNP